MAAAVFPMPWLLPRPPRRQPPRHGRVSVPYAVAPATAPRRQPPRHGRVSVPYAVAPATAPRRQPPRHGRVSVPYAVAPATAPSVSPRVMAASVFPMPWLLPRPPGGGSGGGARRYRPYGWRWGGKSRGRVKKCGGRCCGCEGLFVTLRPNLELAPLWATRDAKI